MAPTDQGGMFQAGIPVIGHPRRLARQAGQSCAGLTRSPLGRTATGSPRKRASARHRKLRRVRRAAHACRRRSNGSPDLGCWRQRSSSSRASDAGLAGGHSWRSSANSPSSQNLSITTFAPCSSGWAAKWRARVASCASVWISASRRAFDELRPCGPGLRGHAALSFISRRMVFSSVPISAARVRHSLSFLPLSWHDV